MQLVADGTATIEFEIVVRDAAGLPLADWPVEITVSGSSNSIVQPPRTDAAGMTVAMLSSTVAESKSVTVRVGTNPYIVTLEDSPNVMFQADPNHLSATLSTISATPAGALAADGIDASTITVVVRDVNGNCVPDQAVTVVSNGTGNLIVQSLTATDANGACNATIASTVAQLKSVSAVLDPSGAALVLANSAAVEFLADPSNISVVLSTITANPGDNVVADGTRTTTITVTVLDGLNNPVAGQTVALAASGSGNALTQPLGLTDVNGTATGQLATTSAELKSISAVVNPGTDNLGLAARATAVFIGDASQIDAGLSSVDADPDTSLVANGVVTSTITTIVRDVNGNAVPGQTVSIAVDGSNNTVTQPSGTTTDDGSIAGALATTLAEVKTITVTVNPGVGAVVLNDQPEVTWIGDAANIDAALSTVTATPTADLVANGADTAQVTVIVRDVNGNSVPGLTAVLSASGTGNALTQPANPSDASGQAVGSVASTLAGSKTINVIVDPGPSQVALGDTPTLQFIGDANNVSADLSSIAVTPRWKVSADGTASIRVDVTLRDVFGNPVPSVPVDVVASGAGNGVDQDSVATDANGNLTAQLTSTVAEAKTVGAIANPGASQVALDDQQLVSFTWYSTGKKYVRTTGSDSNSGDSPADAWRTVDYAASQAIAGMTVFVGGGEYFESVALAADGTSNDPIHFFADSTGDRTGDVGAVVIDGLGASDVIVITGDYVTLEGFEIRGASPTGTEGAGVRVGDAPTQGVILRKNKIHSNRRGLYAKGARRLYLEDNVISNNATGDSIAFFGTPEGGEGVYLSDCEEITVLNNLIYNNAAIGVHATAGSTDVLLRANTLYLNGDDQVQVDGLLNSVVVRDNIASEGLRSGIVLSLGSLLTTSHNVAFGNSLSNFLGLLLGLGDSTANPLILDPLGLDGLLGGTDGSDDNFRIDVSGSSSALDNGSTTAQSVLFTDGTSMADRSSRGDGELDGNGADGVTLNRGYHYPQQTDSLPQLDAGHARAHYGEIGSRQSRIKTRDDTSWSSAAQAPSTATPVRWMQHESSRIDDGEELALIQSEVGSATELSLLRWSGVTWSEAWTADGVDAADAGTRSADLVCLPLGDALAVWSDGTAAPRYRRYSKGEWTAALDVFASSPAGGAVTWVTLIGDVSSSEATLLFADATSALHAVTWAGEAWDEPSAVTLEVALRTIDTQSFDGAYEALSGDCLVTWAGPGGSTRFATRASGSTTWSAAANVPGLASTPAVLDLAAEHSGVRIAFAGLGDAAAGEDLCAAVWNGASWTDVTTLESGAGATLGATGGDSNVAAGWSASSSQALVLYADDASGALHWASWLDGGGWMIEADCVAPSMGFVRSVRLGAGACALISDDAANLHAFEYDGAAWSLDATLTSALPTGAGTAFDLAAER